MTTTNGPISRADEIPTGERTRDALKDTSRTTHHTTVKEPALDTAALITLVRRASALAALCEQPLDRRDLENRLDVSKPTVHRLTRTLGEMGLVERTDGIFVLTKLGETVADVVAEFRRGIETTYRLAPLLETLQSQDSTFGAAAFADATVTTAEPADPYRPVRRYCSLVDETTTLCGFDTTALSPQHIDGVYRRIRDGVEVEFIYPPTAADRLLSAHPERMRELFESGHLAVRVHTDISHGLSIFDGRIGISCYCETTGALRAFIDTESAAAREWAEEVYADYRAEATELSEHPELSQLPSVRALPAVDGD